MNEERPVLELDVDIVDDLKAVCDVKPADVLERAHRGLRECAMLRARRVSEYPLKNQGLSALFRRPTATPVLPLMRTKFGGLPYDEGSNWGGFAFLFQLNFAETDVTHLGFPAQGILAVDTSPIDESFRVRWFADPKKSKTVPCSPDSVGRYECAVDVVPAWSLPSTDAEFLALFEGFPQDALDVLIDWLPVEQLGWTEGTHQLGGWRAAGLFEHYGFEPPPGLPTDISAWTMLLRLDFDNEADFGWGSNVIYVIAPTTDFERGDLSRSVVVGANF
ncbi:MAG: DUF1963 domain-containing protein [bacterium]